MTAYTPADDRYDEMPYARTGRSGLRLPPIALGLWQNFGGVDPPSDARAVVRRAFDLGVTHFDLANNYGPPPGSAEETFGRLLRTDLAGHRDELVISTKAGYRMGPGPYGDGGSRKYLLASLDQSLDRLGLDYVDVFYHHRPDPETPLEETMGALAHAVRQGKALYVGLSNYSADQTRRAAAILRDLGAPCVVHQPRYSLFDRWAEEDGLFDMLEEKGIGAVVYSPLAQGLLTDKYLAGGVPEGSRMAKEHSELYEDDISGARREQLRGLNDVAEARGQSLAQLALAWVLRRPAVTTALVGASRPEQVEENVAALDRLALSEDEEAAIEALLDDDSAAA
ncbi:MAG: L-glyceraldehyde 3-phosphate reductase [Bacteroidetes bacterium QS_8_68_28]|nr:MAG: L-glyceraldehyde 3-phosphate reductase [Bacteroidetes bacterium QS_8_68_28]